MAWGAALVVWTLAWGCSLGYDPTAVRFEAAPGDSSTLNNAANNSDPNNSTNNSTQNNINNAVNNAPVNNTPVNNTPENNNPANNNPVNNTPVNNTPRPIERLGVACGPLGELCAPGGAGWPSCLDAQCQEVMGLEEASCARGAGLWGYCTVPCADDAGCAGSPRDAFAQTMRCVGAGGGGASGWCRPGSQSPCQGDGSCPSGEVCKLVEPAPGGGVEAVCQTATPGGVAAGGYCNEARERGAVRRCRNDLCADDICTSLCGGGEGCGSGNQTCEAASAEAAGLGVAWEGEVCVARACLTAGDCFAEGAATPYCTPSYIGAEGVGGYCRTDNPDAAGSRRLGESCAGSDPGEPDDARCGSRFCTGYAQNFHCSGACRSDADCGSDQVCEVTFFGGSSGTYFANVCKYARGSQQECSDGAPCPSGESCAPYLFGEVVEGGQEVSGAQAVGLCVEDVTGVPRGSGGVGGAGCAERGCVVYGGCLRVEGEDESWCSNVCASELDCADGFTCEELIFLSPLETAELEEVTLRMCRRVR